MKNNGGIERNSRVVRKGFSEEVTFQLRSKWSERGRHTKFWEEKCSRQMETASAKAGFHLAFSGRGRRSVWLEQEGQGGGEKQLRHRWVRPRGAGGWWISSKTYENTLEVCTGQEYALACALSRSLCLLCGEWSWGRGELRQRMASFHAGLWKVVWYLH